MGKIATRIRALSAKAELAVVVVVAFGWFIYLSLNEFVVLVWSSGTYRRTPDTLAELIWQVAFDAAVLVVLGWFLHMRGWTLACLGLDPRLGHGARDLALALLQRAAQGVALVLAVLFAELIAVDGMRTLLQQPMTVTDAARISPDVLVASILGICVLNSIYEELFACGYLITRLRDTRGIWFAITVSTAIRLTYHLYQGLAAAPQHIAMGLIFGYWFARTRQLWPLIFAHGFLNWFILRSEL